MTISLKADSSGTFGEVLVNGSPALKVSNGLLELPDGKDFFNQGNIVGTVSQSGGIPTGAVVERGSNANGEYVRFADGTQIVPEGQVCRLLLLRMFCGLSQQSFLTVYMWVLVWLVCLQQLVLRRSLLNDQRLLLR